MKSDKPERRTVLKVVLKNGSVRSHYLDGVSFEAAKTYFKSLDTAGVLGLVLPYSFLVLNIENISTLDLYEEELAESGGYAGWVRVR